MQAADGRADLRLQDYRDVAGTYDRIVSIEMMEAVGRAYWPDYFATIRDRLAKEGRAVLQVITLDESRYESYQHQVDFIQRYIFPGGMLPTPTIMREQIAAAGLKLVRTFTFGDSYARTLAEWSRRFSAALAAGRGHGLRCPLPAALGVLPRLLRRRVPRRDPERGALHDRARVAFPGGPASIRPAPPRTRS